MNNFRLIAGLILIMSILLPPSVIVSKFLSSGFQQYAAKYTVGLWVFKSIAGFGASLGLLFPKFFSSAFRRADDGISERPVRIFDRMDIVIAAGLILLALPLRIIGLDRSLTFDEVFLVRSLITVDPVRIFFHPSGSAHALHSMLANIFVRLAGVSEWSVRTPAMIFGTLAPAAMFLACKLYLSRQTGIIAGILLCLTPIHIWYSQEAKGNSALVLFILASWISAHMFIAGRKKWAAYAYVISIVCACLSHLSGFLFAVVQTAVLASPAGRVLSNNDNIAGRKNMLALNLMALWFSAMFYSPIVPFLMTAGASATAEEGSARIMVLVASILHRFTVMELGMFCAAASAGIAIAGACRLAYARRNTFLFLIMPFVLCLLVTVASGLFSHARYHMYFLPALVILSAEGVLCLAALMARPFRGSGQCSHRIQIAGTVLLVSLIVSAYAACLRPYYAEPKSNYKAIGKFIISSSSDHTVYCPGPGKKAFPCSGLMFYTDRFETDDTIDEVLERENDDKLIMIAVIDPLSLSVSKPGLSKTLQAEGQVERRYHCLGELDQYRVRDSYVFSMPAGRLKRVIK